MDEKGRILKEEQLLALSPWGTEILAGEYGCRPVTAPHFMRRLSTPTRKSGADESKSRALMEKVVEERLSRETISRRIFNRPLMGLFSRQASGTDGKGKGGSGGAGGGASSLLYGAEGG